VTCYNLHICHITQQGNRKWTRQSLGLNHWSAQSHSNEEGANICKHMFKTHRTNINIIIDLINHHGHWKNSTVFDLFLFHKKICILLLCLPNLWDFDLCMLNCFQQGRGLLLLHLFEVLVCVLCLSLKQLQSNY